MDQNLDGQNSGQHVKIGATKHPARGIVIVLGGVVALGAMLAFYKMSNSSEAPKLKALEDFRAAFAKKCDAEEFRGEASPFLREEFLRSTALQEAVAKQTQAIADGLACADIDRALRTASFPMGARR